MVTINLNEQAKQIVEMAQKSGAEQNFLFTTTFKRYQTQLRLLGELEREIFGTGPIISKEYIKGRENIYSHPAISKYNTTSSAANKTATTLIRIITALKGVSIGVDDYDEDDDL